MRSLIDAVVVLDEEDDWPWYLHPGDSIHNAAIRLGGHFGVTW